MERRHETTIAAFDKVIPPGQHRLA